MSNSPSLNYYTVIESRPERCKTVLRGKNTALTMLLFHLSFGRAASSRKSYSRGVFPLVHAINFCRFIGRLYFQQ